MFCFILYLFTISNILVKLCPRVLYIYMILLNKMSSFYTSVYVIVVLIDIHNNLVHHISIICVITLCSNYFSSNGNMILEPFLNVIVMSKVTYIFIKVSII